MSPDPVTQEPENGKNYNRYTYAFNNPLRYTDPSGYASEKVDVPMCFDTCKSEGLDKAMEEVLVTAPDLSEFGRQEFQNSLDLRDASRDQNELNRQESEQREERPDDAAGDDEDESSDDDEEDCDDDDPAPRQRCINECLAEYYGESYYIAESLNPAVPISLAVSAISNIVSDGIEIFSSWYVTANIHAGDALRSPLDERTRTAGYRQMRTLSQFRGFNIAVLGVGIAAGAYQLGAYGTCSYKCM